MPKGIGTAYYYFLVQTDGSFCIGEAQGKQAHNFDTGRSPAIARGTEPNTIAAECVDGPQGVTLRMFVNGIAVNTVIDSEQPIRIGATGSGPSPRTPTWRSRSTTSS
jgi:hypothetical protein